MAETEKQFDLRVRSAERAHDQRVKMREVHEKQIEAFAIAALRTPALVAAGGIAAALGFYSANYDRLAEDVVKLGLFNGILFWLFLSLLFSVVAPALAYFSQIAYVLSYMNEIDTYEHPFTKETRKSWVYGATGHVLRWSTVVVVLASILFLAWGGYTFLRLIDRTLLL